MVKEYKLIRLDTETYKALEDKVPEGSFNEKIKRLINRPELIIKKQRNSEANRLTSSVPKPIIELAMLKAYESFDITGKVRDDNENLHDVSKITDFGFIRTQFIGATQRILEDLGWQKERPEFFESLGHRSPILIAFDNGLASLVRKEWIIKVEVKDKQLNEYINVLEDLQKYKTFYKYSLNNKLSKERLNLIEELKARYLVEAKEIVKEEKGFLAWSRKNRIPSSK